MEHGHAAWMEEAIALSRESVRSGGGPFGTVIVKDGIIVGRGMNRVTVWNDPTAHGEIVAIRDACTHLGAFQLDGCELYTNAEPCPMCFGAIYWARPKAVYFGCTHDDAKAIGFDDAFIHHEIALPQGERSIPFVQLMRKEALDVFRLWEMKSDRIPY